MKSASSVVFYNGSIFDQQHFALTNIFIFNYRPDYYKPDSQNAGTLCKTT